MVKKNIYFFSILLFCDIILKNALKGFSMSRSIITNANVNGMICNIVTENGKILSVNQEKGLKGIDADGRRVVPGMIETKVILWIIKVLKVSLMMHNTME